MNVIASIYVAADTSQTQHSLGTSKPFKKKDVGVGRIMLAQVQACMTVRKLEESPNQQILFHGE